MIYDVNNPLICKFATHIFVQSSANFQKKWIIVFLLLVLRILWHIFWIQLFISYTTGKYFLPNCSLSFHSLVSKKQTFFILKGNLLHFFHLWTMLLLLYLRTLCLTQGYTDFPFCFLLVIVLGFTYKFKIHFEFIINCIKYELKFTWFFVYGYPINPAPFVKNQRERERLSFF